LPEAGSKGRDAAIQPHVLHWVLALGNLRTEELENPEPQRKIKSSKNDWANK